MGRGRPKGSTKKGRGHSSSSNLSLRRNSRARKINSRSNGFELDIELPLLHKKEKIGDIKV